eukprot:g5411.t1
MAVASPQNVHLTQTLSNLAEHPEESHNLDIMRDGSAVRHLFQCLDINSDGEVSVIEFMIGIRVVADRLGPSFAITAPMELFSNFEPGEDADDGGGITMDAFISETFRIQHPTFNKIIRAVALDAGVECSPPGATTHEAVQSHKSLEMKTNSNTSLREHVRSSIKRIADDMETYGLDNHVAEAAATRRASMRMMRRMSIVHGAKAPAGEDGNEETFADFRNRAAGRDMGQTNEKRHKILGTKDSKVEADDSTGQVFADPADGIESRSNTNNNASHGAHGGAVRAASPRVAGETTGKSLDRDNVVQHKISQNGAGGGEDNSTELQRLRNQLVLLTKKIERQDREIKSLRNDRACILNFCKEYVGRDKLLELAHFLREKKM